MKNYISAILLAIFAIPSLGQSISIFDIDTTNFPTMKAKFYAFDKVGKQYKPNASELTITENGINRTITNVSCPNIPPYTLSVGIMVDTYGQIDLARKGVQKLIDFLYLPQDEIGITYMAKGVYIYQDFTKNKQKASASAALIPSAPGVDVNAMFYSQYTGGIPFIKDRKSDKKILILVSDLHCPNLNINETQLISDAKANNISIYSVLLGSTDYTGLFNRIAQGTSGRVFEKVTDENQITNIFQEIERIERYDPCDIEWSGSISCDPLSIKVELKWQNEKSSLIYIPINNYVAKLKVTPNFISFGRKSPLTQNDTTITIISQNDDFTLTGINRIYGSSDFTIVNTTFPITIPKNTSKDITLKFAPIDSGFNYAIFEIETNKCSAYFSCNGGFPEKKSNSTTTSLKLTNPNGGEFFVAGSDTIITWTGISPSEEVQLEYSIDSGKTWKIITDNATDLKYNWRKLPLPVSKHCLVRISQELKDIFNILTLTGHKQMVRGVSFSPDGNLFATGSSDGTIKIWDTATGIELRTLDELASVNDIAFSPNGMQISTACDDNTAKIWDVNTGALIRTLNGNTGGIKSIAYSPDGTQIATGSNDDTAKIWDVSTGALIRTLNGHSNAVVDITYSPDGKQIATASYDGTARIWDTNTGSIIRSLLGHTAEVVGIAYSPDGKQIATASYDKSARIWEVSTGKITKQFLEYNLVFSVAFSPNSSLIAIAISNSVKIYNANTKAIYRTLIGHNSIIEDIKFDLNKDKIATASWDNTAKIWELKPLSLADISDSVFSIIAPEANFNKLNIDMGRVVLGQNKDTMITDVLCNIGAAPLHVMGVDVTNGNVSDFMVPRGAGEFYLAPNECRPFMFDFMPTQLGIRNAKITVKSTIGDFVDTINIIGEGIAPQLEIVNNLIDFGLVDVWSFKDTIQVVTIKNVGSAALNINNSIHLGPNDIDFTTLSGAPPFSLNVGETAKMNLRFAPKAKGRTSGRVQFEFNGAGSPATVQLFGTGIGSNAIIKVGKDSAFTEEQVVIPVAMEIPNLLIQDGVTAISFELEMNKTILFPIGVNSIIDDDNRIIKFDSVPIKNVGVNEVAKLKFIATLGNVEETTIRVRNIIPIGNDADFDVIDGNFKLLGVCKEGGDRFLSSSFSQTKLLSIAPNPATESIEIEYSNADEGEAEIIISNLLGQTILTQKLEKTQTGKTKLDLSQLPTGQYSILFKTETVLENRVIQVIK